MAETRTINVDIKSNADAAAKEFENVADSVQDVDTQVENLNNGTNGGVKGFKKMSVAAKGLGTALKAAGIGLVIAAFAKFTEVLNENQKVADFFSITFESLSIAFNDFFDFIFDNVGGIVDSFKAIFEDPIQSIKDLGNAIVDNIVERFNSAIEAIGFLGEALVKVFSGDFAGAVESAKEAGKEIIDVYTGVDDTFDKTAEVIEKAVDATKKYVTETVKTATANVELAKSAEIAAVQQQGLIEKYDRQAEKLRQTRDTESNSIAERLEANEKLGKTLDEQEKAMLKLADLQIASAAAEFKKNQNQANTIALLEAQNNKAAVLAQIEGFRSEQIQNQDALIREQLELTNSQAESEANLGIERKRLNAEAIEDDLTRLEEQQKIDEEEEKLQTERLQRVIDQAKEGTQAKVDAQIALDEFEVEIAQKKLEREKEIGEKEIENAKAVADAKKAIQDAQFSNAEAAIGLLKNLAGENNKLQALAIAAENAVGIAKIIISTQAANAAAKLKYAAIPGGLALAAAEITSNKISAGIGIAASVAAAAKGIASLKASAPLDTGGDLGGGGAGSEPQAPSFNVVGDSGVNQLAQLQQQPTQAFVVSGEVTTAQALDRNRVQNATL